MGCMRAPVTVHIPTHARPTKCAKFQLMHEFYEICPDFCHIYGKFTENLYKSWLLFHVITIFAGIT